MSMHAHSEIAREATTVVVLAEEVGAVKARRTSALAELDELATSRG